MGKLKKVGIGFGIVILSFFILIVVIALSYDDEATPSNSIIVDQSQTHGNFEVTVESVSNGFSYFRVDMSVKNISDDDENFGLKRVAIIDDKNRQYDALHGVNLDGYKVIHPGVVKDGYVEFDSIPDDVKTVTLFFDLGNVFDLYQFEFEIPLES